MILRINGVYNVWHEDFPKRIDPKHSSFRFTSEFECQVSLLEILSKDGKRQVSQVWGESPHIGYKDCVEYRIEEVDGKTTGGLYVKSNDQVGERSESQPTENA